MNTRRSTSPALIASALVLTALAACNKKTDTPKEEKPPPSTPSWNRDPKGPPPPPTVKKSEKGDCSTDYAPRPDRDPNPMCKIAAGTFQMGSPEGEGHDDEHPQHPVTLSAFYLDQFEVTNAQYVFFLNAVGTHVFCETAVNRECAGVRPYPKWAEIEKQKDGTYAAIAGTERQPATRVSREGAELYCKWVGKALPTEAQWEYAARHDPETNRDLRYPWGDEFEPKRAACKDEHCQDGFKDVAPVGTFDGTGGFGDGTSPWGIHDMAGNALEWVADCYSKSYAWCKDGCTDPTGPSGAPGCEATTRGSAGDYATPRVLRAASRDNLVGDTASGGIRCARPESDESSAP